MAPRIEHIVFIAGGVLVQRLEDLVLDIIYPGASPPNQTRIKSFALERRVAIGDISPRVYCQQMAALAGVDNNGKALSAAVAERVAPLPGFVNMLAGLVDKATLSLVSDYPRQWLFPAISRSGLDATFNESNTYFLDDHKVPADYPLFFSFLVEEDILQPGTSLWVDCNSSRTSAAIRQGIDAAIFVDAERFYRDLGLWSLVPLATL